MKKFILVSTVGVSSLFLILACSAKKAGRFGDLSGEVSEAFARSVLDTPTILTDLFVGNVPTVNVKKSLDRTALKLVQNGMIRMATSPLGSCDSVGTGDLRDKDADDIPVNANFKVDCSSPNEFLKASYTLKDHNDGLAFPKAGFSLQIDSIEGRLANNNTNLVDFNLESSNFEIKIEGATSTATGSAGATLKVAGSRADIGFEGSATYSGNVNARREGDKATASGKVRYTGSAITGITDADIVAQVDADLTMGDCGGDNILVKSGTATLKDARKNVVQATVTNCELKITFNGKSMPINRAGSIMLPKY